MTMTPVEIAADYRQAKSKLKQIHILADLNQCDTAKIKEILIEQGEKLPGNCSAPGVKKAKRKALPKEDPVPAAPEEKQEAPAAQQAPDEEETVSARVAVPLLTRIAAVQVIDELLKASDAGDDAEFDSVDFRFREQVRGVLALMHEIESRCEEGADETTL